MKTDEGQGMLPLPGLEPDPPASTRRGGALVASTRRTIAALHALGLLEERHAAQCALALVLAEACEGGAASRRASAVAMAARELRECLDSLPKPEGDGKEDAFERMMREFAEQENVPSVRRAETPSSHAGPEDLRS